MKGLVILFSLVTRSLAAGLRITLKENTGDLIPDPMMAAPSIVSVTMDIIEEWLRTGPFGRNDVQCTSCNYWRKLKLTGKLVLYFSQCKHSNGGDKQQTFLCLH